MENFQLLCTFTTVDNLDTTIKNIISSYTIAFDKIYVLENIEIPNSLYCTYNIDLSSTKNSPTPPPYTISLHRKKLSNTLYTINALNLLVLELNNGISDPNFEIPWEDYKGTILVSAYKKLKVIKTKLNKIVDIRDIY